MSIEKLADVSESLQLQRTKSYDSGIYDETSKVPLQIEGHNHNMKLRESAR